MVLFRLPKQVKLVFCGNLNITKMILPKSKEEKLIKDLKVGESCYTVPWAMWVNKDNVCFLREDFKASSSKGGTVELKIERVEDGYIAYIHSIDYKWTPSNDGDDGVIGGSQESMYGKIIGFGVNSYETLTKDELEDELNKALSEEAFEKAIEIRDYIKRKYP